MTNFSKPVYCGAAWLMAGAFAALANAEPLPDPTRPPAGIITESGAPGQMGEQAPAANHGLQSVIIAPNRRSVIIDGHAVDLGGKYGAYTLIEIKEGSITLRDANGKRISMSMFPGVGIRNKSASSGQDEERPGDRAGSSATQSQPVRKSTHQVPREAK